MDCNAASIGLCRPRDVFQFLLLAIIWQKIDLFYSRTKLDIGMALRFTTSTTFYKYQIVFISTDIYHNKNDSLVENTPSSFRSVSDCDFKHEETRSAVKHSYLEKEGKRTKKEIRLHTVKAPHGICQRTLICIPP